MSYINVGAEINGVPAKTKKALKEAMQSAPETVVFYSTSDFTTGAWYGHHLPKDDKLQVVGPDPYTKRVWYATVTDNGKVS